MKEKIIFTNGLIDLAQPRLGTKVIYKTDDFFASANRIISPTIPVFKEGVFDKHGKWMNMMRDKLGLYGLDNKDNLLILDLLTWMHEKQADYTNTFCHLMNIEQKKELLYEDNNFINWKKRWKERLLKNDKTQKKYLELMRNNNPLVIPRNHKVEEALNAADQNNFKPIFKILEILSKPYNDQKNINDYQYPNLSNEKYQTFCGT